MTEFVENFHASKKQRTKFFGDHLAFDSGLVFIVISTLIVSFLAQSLTSEKTQTPQLYGWENGEENKCQWPPVASISLPCLPTNAPDMIEVYTFEVPITSQEKSGKLFFIHSSRYSDRCLLVAFWQLLSTVLHGGALPKSHDHYIRIRKMGPFNGLKA